MWCLCGSRVSSTLCSCLQAVISVVIMFGIQWGYTLCNFLAFLMIYIYIGQFNPGVFPGRCACVCVRACVCDGEGACVRGCARCGRKVVV